MYICDIWTWFLSIKESVQLDAAYNSEYNTENCISDQFTEGFRYSMHTAV